MAYTTINKSTDYFNTKLYSGNSSTQSITGVGFQPDFTWIKDRNDTGHHQLLDAVRGVTKYLSSNDTDAEATSSNGLTAFNSDGFSLGDNTNYNNSSRIYASWNWKANGSGSANTTGTINSTVSANTTAGFSISKFTGTGSAATVGHGLGAVPKMYIVKNLSTGSTQWRVYHASLGATKHMALDATQAVGTASGVFNNTEPTSSVFSVGTDDAANKSGDNLIAYAFAEKTGYSKFGSYTGTSSEVFIYTGFKPRFILIKKTSEAASWHLFDTSRTVSNGGNQLNKILFPNLSNAESDDAYNYVDAVSNGFRCFSGPSGQGTETNKNGQTFIYMAFGQSLVGSNNVPCTAR